VNRTGRGKALLLGVALTAALLAAGEMASRWLRFVELPDPVIAKDFPRWMSKRIYDPLLFWRMRPNQTKDGKPWTNSLGLRGPEIPPKRDDEFRILSLGESTTFGAGLDAGDQTYSDVVQEALRSVGGRSVRVVNAGVGAYTLLQGFVFLEHRGLALEPDAVLTYFGYNDFLTAGARATRDQRAWSAATQAMTDRQLLEQRRQLSFRLSNALLERSNLFRTLVFRGSPSISEVVLESDVVRVPEADRRWLLAQLRDRCRELGIRFVVAVPWYRDFDAHESLLREFAAENGVTIVDLPVLLKDLEARKAELFLDLAHPNAEGHRAIGLAIASELQQAWGDDPGRRRPGP
jgi:lysophospholipase L1-like esterase